MILYMFCCYMMNYRGEVGNGSIVRVNTPLPHPVDQDLAQIEQDRHLQGVVCLFADIKTTAIL